MHENTASMIILLFFILMVTRAFAFHVNRCISVEQKLKTKCIKAPLYKNVACKMSDSSEASGEVLDGLIEPIIVEKRKMSWPFSMFDAPDVLDGSLAGDAGFDPLGLAKDKESLFLLREAEIKHARLAMLAVVGWPISEIYHYQLSVDFGLQDELIATGGRAPSVLNGGLDNINVLLSLGLFIAVGGVLEFELMRRRQEIPDDLRNFFDMWREDGWDMPGNYGFDPLQFGTRICTNDQSKRTMGTVEIFNGRMAMLAMLGFVVQEYITKLPVIRETPQFFFLDSI
jgi:hypothetical protein